MGQRYQKK